jgi:hypothetical protein
MQGLAADADLTCFPDIVDALREAEAKSRPGDCILVFGSFTTVEAALRWTHSRVLS